LGVSQGNFGIINIIMTRDRSKKIVWFLVYIPFAQISLVKSGERVLFPKEKGGWKVTILLCDAAGICMTLAAIYLKRTSASKCAV